MKQKKKATNVTSQPKAGNPPGSTSSLSTPLSPSSSDVTRPVVDFQITFNLLKGKWAIEAGNPTLGHLPRMLDTTLQAHVRLMCAQRIEDTRDPRVYAVETWKAMLGLLLPVSKHWGSVTLHPDELSIRGTSEGVLSTFWYGIVTSQASCA